MRKKLLALLVVLVAFYSAHSQLMADSILVENHYRSFHFNNPTVSTKSFHLVFVLHGSGGDGTGMLKPAISLEKIAGKQGWLLVYPDGYKKYWNECRKAATSAANIENINEEAFFASMLQYFSKNYHTNAQSFFAIGLSGGGQMSYKLALTMPEKCRAICAVVANLPDSTNMDCIEAKKPVPVMIINGTNDPVNPYAGGPMVVNGSSFGSVLSTENSFKYWASLAGYTGQPTMKNLPDRDTSNHQTITRYTYKQKGKPEVTLLKVTGGGHAFPGDVDAFIEASNFFKRALAFKK